MYHNYLKKSSLEYTFSCKVNLLGTGIFYYLILSAFCSRFYPRWKETEASNIELLNFTLEESQWQQDWATILSLANQPGQ